MAVLAHASSAHRERVLRALGVTPWVRRVPSDAAVEATEIAPAAVSSGECVVLLPAGCSQRELDLVGRALMTSGATAGARATYRSEQRPAAFGAGGPRLSGVWRGAGACAGS